MDKNQTIKTDEGVEKLQLEWHKERLDRVVQAARDLQEAVGYLRNDVDSLNRSMDKARRDIKSLERGDSTGNFLY